jgi:5'-nucleotidase
MPDRAHSGGSYAELLEQLGKSSPKSFDIDRRRRVYVNRNLRMDDIDLIGFDMDYTLALYNQRNLESLSITCTLDKLIKQRNYPEDLKQLSYDPQFAIRGLVIDRRCGNILKMDRFGHAGRVYHGKQPLDKDERHRLYRTQRIRLSQPRYAWLDTLFALPEAVMYATIIDHQEKNGEKLKPSRLWQDIRECIDEAHRDDSMKSVIKANVGKYIERDPDLAATLHKFRSSGKRLFVLTNSAWDYTEAVMSYLLDGALPAYPSWRQYFDIAIVSGKKPEFFTERHPFVELDNNGVVKGPVEGAFVRNRLYQGGNIVDFESMAGARGERVLYIGDHIYGDMLRAKKSSVWRTAMILQELEDELVQMEATETHLQRLEFLDRQCSRVEAEINYQQLLLKSLQKLAETEPDSEKLEHAKREAKKHLDELRGNLKKSTEEMDSIESTVDAAFNPYWGAMFREGAENSRFGQQVDDYACVYTSRVSNFLAYSPLRFFRSPRNHMPHELV